MEGVTGLACQDRSKVVVVKKEEVDDDDDDDGVEVKQSRARLI